MEADSEGDCASVDIRLLSVVTAKESTATPDPKAEWMSDTDPEIPSESIDPDTTIFAALGQDADIGEDVPNDHIEDDGKTSDDEIIEEGKHEEIVDEKETTSNEETDSDGEDSDEAESESDDGGGEDSGDEGEGESDDLAGGSQSDDGGDSSKDGEGGEAE
jgi:hypothetical protein